MGKFAFGTIKPGHPENAWGSVTVDQFMVWNREISDADVIAVYNAQL